MALSEPFGLRQSPRRCVPRHSIVLFALRWSSNGSFVLHECWVFARVGRSQFCAIKILLAEISSRRLCPSLSISFRVHRLRPDSLTGFGGWLEIVVRYPFHRLHSRRHFIRFCGLAQQTCAAGCRNDMAVPAGEIASVGRFAAVARRSIIG